ASAAQAETSGEVVEALARVQEEVIDVKEDGLAESFGGCYRGIRFCCPRSARQARDRSALRRCGLPGARLLDFVLLEAPTPAGRRRHGGNASACSWAGCA